MQEGCVTVLNSSTGLSALHSCVISEQDNYIYLITEVNGEHVKKTVSEIMRIYQSEGFMATPQRKKKFGVLGGY